MPLVSVSEYYFCWELLDIVILIALFLLIMATWGSLLRHLGQCQLGHGQLVMSALDVGENKGLCVCQVFAIAGLVLLPRNRKVGLDRKHWIQVPLFNTPDL